ncbi:MAG: hypothetical protein R3247_06315 [Rhodothermales bacterium]|nr:hypothetical protein [Rhodothermales bacterium]
MLLLVFGTLAGLGIAEVFVRSALDIYECDEQLGWSYSPGMTGVKVSRSGEFANVVRFNELGFRDEEHALEKDDDTYRILLLGDSFVGGLQVPIEAAFPTLLEQQLNRGGEAGDRVEVINAGVDGYGTAQQLLLFKERLHRYQPDLTILSVFLYTDLSDNFYEAGHQNHHLARKCGRPYFVRGEAGLQPYTVEQDEQLAPRRPLDGLLGWSVLYSALVPPPPLAPAFHQRELFRTEYSESQLESWALTQQLMLALAAEVERHGSEFAVLNVPHGIQVGQSFPNLAPTYFQQEQLENSLNMMNHFLHAHDVPAIDLVPAMQRAIAGGELLYYEDDGHWNRDGHRVVADVLLGWLRERCPAIGLDHPSCLP